MIDLTLNSFLHPNLVGLKPPFGTIIERTAENKGGLSTAQTDNNMAMPFALMRPVTVAISDTTSKVEYDAKLLLTGDTPLTIYLDDATYEGCVVTIVNGSTAQATLVAVGKLNGTDTGTFNLPTGRIAVIIWRSGWITLQETTSDGAFSAPPLDFIYLQFRGQKAPDVLFPGITWQNISSTYKGRFFRAEGGNAASFGDQQDGGLPDIVGSIGAGDNGHSTYGIVMTGLSFTSGAMTEGTPRRGSFSGSGTPGSDIYFAASRYNTIYGNATEVRPINDSIRIWKRTA